MLIRPMSVGDAVAVASLIREMQYRSDAEQIAARYEAIASQANNAMFVAERNGLVVGWAHVRIVELLQMDPYAALVGIAVQIDMRGQQVGATLIAACRAWAAQRGHHEVRVP
jgi:predicted N-acetyltransferase YhbS